MSHTSSYNHMLIASLGQMMPTMEKGSDNTRYPATTVLATSTEVKAGKSSNMDWKELVNMDRISSIVPGEEGGHNVRPKVDNLGNKSTTTRQRRNPSVPELSRNGRPLPPVVVLCSTVNS